MLNGPALSRRRSELGTGEAGVAALFSDVCEVELLEATVFACLVRTLTACFAARSPLAAFLDFSRDEVDNNDVSLPFRLFLPISRASFDALEADFPSLAAFFSRICSMSGVVVILVPSLFSEFSISNAGFCIGFVSDSRNILKSGSWSMVPTRVSVRFRFDGIFWLMANSNTGGPGKTGSFIVFFASVKIVCRIWSSSNVI